MKLKKQEPIGYMFSESVMVKYLPERAIAEMVAMKMGIDLTKYPEFEKERKEKKATELSQNKQQFSASKERYILTELKKRGKKRKGKVVKRTAVTYEMSRNLKASEESIRMEFAKKPKVATIIGKPGPSTTPMPSGRPDEVISIVYAYDWINGFDDSDLDTSREFCVELRAMSNEGHRWTREDIEGISSAGFPDTWGGEVDIWAMRGGWYNRNGVNAPHCRHTWSQEVIREII